MKLNQTLAINAINIALLSVIPPIEDLPRPSRVPLLFPQPRPFPSRLTGGSETQGASASLQAGRRGPAVDLGLLRSVRHSREADLLS